MLDTGIRDVRNQGVILNGVNADPHALLDLCFALLDGAQIMPYYFYMCDMIPFSEHWRVSVADAQRLQHAIMGYLPGFATPRIVCDVPFVGKRWVHQLAVYDTERGISLLDEELPHLDRGRRTPRRSRAPTSTTTRSTPCPRPGRRGGPSTASSTSRRSRPPRSPRPRGVRPPSRPTEPLLARSGATRHPGRMHGRRCLGYGTSL